MHMQKYVFLSSFLAVLAFSMAAAGALASQTAPPVENTLPPLLTQYFDPVQGSSSVDFIRRALASNSDLAAARLEVDRARGRLRQAGLVPNPSIDFEQTTGKFTGAEGEREISVGFAFPVELGRKRQRRVDVARLGVEIAEADLRDRERRLVAEVRTAYLEALVALRELRITEEQHRVDIDTIRFVQIRVNEGDVPRLDLNLVQADADRLAARKALLGGRLHAAVLRLKVLTGLPQSESPRLRDALETAAPPEQLSVDEVLQLALRNRPDLRAARLREQAAEAGLRLAQAQAVADIVPFTRFTVGRSVFDETPVGPLRDRDKLFTFGVSIGLPVFNRNQGFRAEAAAAVTQARHSREFVERTIRAEVESAYGRYEAARASLILIERGVVDRTKQNVNTIRAAYEIGAFSITDLLTEQRRLLDVQREMTETLAELFRAFSDLRSATGDTTGEVRP